MDLSDLIAIEDILPDLRPHGKRRLLQDLAERAASRPCVKASARQILDMLLQREQLGSTGVGNGIAIPHAKLPGIERIAGLFAKLEKPVDFDALDDQPVDLVFLLLVPEGAGADHLKALACVARVMRKGDVMAELRKTSDPHAIYALLTGSLASNAA